MKDNNYINTVFLLIPACFYVVGIILFFILKKKHLDLFKHLPLKELRKIHKIDKYTFWVVFVIYGILSFTSLYFHPIHINFFDISSTIFTNFMFPFFFGWFLLMTKHCLKEREKEKKIS
jgi:drug/metabolite transporter (DMT)-like permease